MDILVDDKRELNRGIICRDFKSAKLVLNAISESDDYLESTLYLDHDFGEGEGKEGIDILKWAYGTFVRLPVEVVLVSDNPVGVKNMADALTNDFHFKADPSGRRFSRGD